MSGASGGDWALPDLEVDHDIAVTRDESGDRGVTRTTSLLVTGVDMDKPLDSAPGDMDVLAKRDEVLRDLEEKKNQMSQMPKILQQSWRKTMKWVSKTT